MLQIKDGRKLLDEIVAGLWLPNEDDVAHIAQNSKLRTYPDKKIGSQLMKMQLCQHCPEMLLPQFGSSTKTIKGALLRRQMMLVSWMNSRGGTTKISDAMGVFRKADDTSNDVTCQLWMMLYSREKGRDSGMIVLQHRSRCWHCPPVV